MQITHSRSLNESADWLFEQDDVIHGVDQLLVKAIEWNISDIHIEPHSGKYRIRFREDGLLYDFTYLESSSANGMIARLKVLSHLDVAEKRLPQDGHFSFKRALKSIVDFRLSTCPTIDGEKVAVRILNPTSLLKSIEELGFEPTQKEQFLSALNRPQGLILLVGPTGSGKTVSMYAALQLLNSRAKNILTLEDPVEINVEGINQVNINPKVGLTFANGLRAFLRQDPDVIMLGEVRDAETAEIVIKSSQTGHLILSTLHAQNTIQVFDRLLNLDLTKDQIQSNLLLVVAQRLIRKLCDVCKKPSKVSVELLHSYKPFPKVSLFEPSGCQYCQLGYRGRVGVFELLTVTPEVISAFLQSNHRVTLEKLLKKTSLSLRDAALYKVSQGITNLAEVDRIIPKEL